MDTEKTGSDDSQEEHDIRAAKSCEDLINYMKRHRFSKSCYPSMERTLKRITAISERAGVDPDSAQQHLLDGLRILVLTYFTDPGSRSDDPPVGVREPRKRSPSGRSSAAAVTEPDDDRISVDAVSGRRLR